ncbi:MAG: MYXO-CTERM sorting domain-containing protein, partial [Polyangiaceae bacterium]
GDLVAEGAGELAVDSPELTIAASSLRQLRLRASREGGEGAASLWWTTDADATFAASRSVPLELPADGDPADVALELSPLGITGTLTGLRVVAFDATSDEATLRIDELELTGDDTVTPPTTGDEAVEDGCGCRIPGDRRTNDPPWMALALGGLLLWRRRRA